MYARVLTFTGTHDIDAGVSYIRQEVVPVLHAQHGYRGLTVSADRAGSVMGVLSLWETAADRSASDSALGKARREGQQIAGGELTVEHFEQATQLLARPPVAGCALAVVRLHMDPAAVDDNTEFFQSTVAPQIEALPGFCALRQLLDRSAGREIVGSVWESRAAMEAAMERMAELRAMGEARGITFDEMSLRELLLVDNR